MRKQRWLIIIVLLAGAAGLGYKLRTDWRTFHANNDPRMIKLRPVSPVATPDALSPHDYVVVAQQNPFHPERNDVVPPPPVVQAPTGPPPLIYGSMILGTERFALMGMENDPKPRKVMEGESFGGYKLAQVLPQSVVLESGGAKSEVMLYNALARLRRDQSRTQSSSGGSTAGTGPTSAPLATTVSGPAPYAPPPLPPATSNTPAPPGKKLVETPFGPMWVDAK
jgi:hypothetical protein